MSLHRIVVKRYGSTRRNEVNIPSHIENGNIDEVKSSSEENLASTKETPNKNNKKKAKKDMVVTEEQIVSAENVAMDLSNKKILKKDKGLIERTESSKIILAEDNRQLLND